MNSLVVIYTVPFHKQQPQDYPAIPLPLYTINKQSNTLLPAKPKPTKPSTKADYLKKILEITY